MINPNEISEKYFDELEISQERFYSNWDPTQLTDIQERETLSTGVTELDNTIPFPTGFYVICANPGVGKGWFALWLSRQFYKRHRKKTVYFSLEMAEPLVRSRVLQQWSDLTKDQAENNLISKDKAINSLKKNALVVDEFFSTSNPKKQTPENFIRKLDFYYHKGFRVFHFDHMHELSGANVNDTNQKVVEDWASAFQRVAKEYPKVWLFVYAQPNGAAAKKVILTKTDVSGSKAIGQKCEFFISLNREKNESNFSSAENENRDMFVWLDKGRTVPKTHVGAWVYFDHTGNFTTRREPINNYNEDYFA